MPPTGDAGHPPFAKGLALGYDATACPRCGAGRTHDTDEGVDEHASQPKKLKATEASPDNLHAEASVCERPRVSYRAVSSEALKPGHIVATNSVFQVIHVEGDRVTLAHAETEEELVLTTKDFATMRFASASMATAEVEVTQEQLANLVLTAGDVPFEAVYEMKATPSNDQLLYIIQTALDDGIHVKNDEQDKKKRKLVADLRLATQKGKFVRCVYRLNLLEHRPQLHFGQVNVIDLSSLGVVEFRTLDLRSLQEVTLRGVKYRKKGFSDKTFSFREQRYLQVFEGDKE